VRIRLSSIMVKDQDQALAFYTDVLGFIKKNDIPMGAARWLTLVSPEGPNDMELVLEPLGFPPSKVYQQQLFEAGIAVTALEVADIQAEYERLLKRGVVFKHGPTPAGPVTLAAFDDTCGNWIQMFQVAKGG
jgi:catechol 2,3-dioxygenase-like lactoylglutathione lyase family enzyme